MLNFEYKTAFRCNLGWITEEEQEKLKRSVVGIAGIGGVGGSHLMTLVRLGVEKFHLADFDVYEMHNFNRQYGADMKTIGQKKVEIMLEKARAINPLIKVKIWREGLTEDNLKDFVKGLDLFVDGLDIHEIFIRKKAFHCCKENRIPAITVAPIGMGAALISFLPGRMSLQDYFGFSGDKEEDTIRFIAGLTPGFLQKKSLVDRKYVQIKNKRMPSTPMGCFIASGVMGTEALKIILNRKDIIAAPWSIHYDAYSYRLRRSYSWLGRFNPLFIIKMFYLKMILKS